MGTFFPAFFLSSARDIDEEGTKTNDNLYTYIQYVSYVCIYVRYVLSMIQYVCMGSTPVRTNCA